MNRARKRILSMALALCMVVSMMVTPPLTLTASAASAQDMAEGTWAGKNGHRYITFGKYNGYDLVWRVLEVKNNDSDHDGKKTAFLVLDDVLRNEDGSVEMRQFNSTDDNTWSSSGICDFLNGVFLTDFESAEKDALLMTTLSELSGNPSSSVFLLSRAEAENTNYFTGNDDRAAAYNWWTRSPSPDGNTHSYYVGPDGGIAYSGSSTSRDYAIRPALKVNLNCYFNNIDVSYGVQITVSDNSTISGARVTVGDISAFTNTSGMAELVLPSGTHNVTVKKAGYAEQRQDISVSANNTAETIILTADNGLTDKMYFGSYKGGSILWQVLDLDDDAALLLADNYVERSEQFDRSDRGNWNISSIRDWLNGASSGEFLENFTTVETAAMPRTEDYTLGGIYDHEGYGLNTPDSSQVFLLSVDEVKLYLPDNKMRTLNIDNWWLRSPGSISRYAAMVDYVGLVSSGGTSAFGTCAIRPAFHLNLESVFFASYASGASAKSKATVGGNLVDAQASTGAKKLTLFDDLQVLNVYGLTSSNDSLTFTYDAGTVKIGQKQYISCVLVDSDGDVAYYGKLEDLNSVASGTVTVPLTGVPDATYTLKIFTEQVNGDQYTDYASQPFEIEIEVSNLSGSPKDNIAPTVSSITPANNDTDIAISGNIEIKFSEAMNPANSTDSVTLTSGDGMVNTPGVWSPEKKTYTISYSGLDRGTAYTIHISGFRDVAGNEMADATSSFTTEGGTVTPPPATLEMGDMEDDIATEGESYYKVIPVTYTNGTATDLTYTVTGLPSGIRYTSQGFSGEVSGTPKKGSAGSYPITVTVEDGTGLSDSGDYTLIVETALEMETLYLATPSDATATVGEPFVMTLSVTYTGSDTLEYSADGLPEGLDIDPDSGVISGIPTQDGDYDVTATVEERRGSLFHSQSFEISVTDETPLPQPNTYAVIVNGSYASSSGAGRYEEDDTVTIRAGTRSGYRFSEWTVNSGSATPADATRATTTFTMPANNVTVTAGWTKTGDDDTDSDSDKQDTSLVQAPEPNMPVEVRMTIPTTPDAAGHLTLTLTDEMVKAQVEQAQSEMTRRNKKGDGFTVAFRAETLEEIKSLTVHLDAAALARLISSGTVGLEIDTSVLGFTFDKATLASLGSQSDGRVTLTGRPAANLSAQARALIGSRPVWDINITSTKSGDPVNISSFGKGNLTLRLSYVPTANERTGSLYAVHVDGNGAPQLLTGSSYKDGWLLISRNSLSVYGVGYKTPDKEFTDTGSHWAKDDIDFVASRELLTGTDDTTFSPNAMITRGMFVTALGRLSGQDVSSYTESSFTDVKTDSYYLPYIEWAVKNKIVSGIGNHQFAPDREITREDMAVMMENYARATGYTLPRSREAVSFLDENSISNYAKEAVRSLHQAGIINGKTANRFDPKGNATRAEVSAMLRRFVELVIDDSTARGWTQLDNGSMQYIDWQGRRLTGWQDIGGVRYYFNSDGTMSTS